MTREPDLIDRIITIARQCTTAVARDEISALLGETIADPPPNPAGPKCPLCNGSQLIKEMKITVDRTTGKRHFGGARTRPCSCMPETTKASIIDISQRTIQSETDAIMERARNPEPPRTGDL